LQLINLIIIIIISIIIIITLGMLHLKLSSCDEVQRAAEIRAMCFPCVQAGRDAGLV
jgi:hypothetical protein